MYLGPSSDFGAVDLLGSLVANVGGTYMAAKQPDFRVGIKTTNKKTGQKEVKAFLDYRFLGGAAALAAATFTNVGGPTGRRVMHDASTGLLNSFVATETMRRMSLQSAAGAAPQIAQGAPAALGAADQVPAEAAVAGNYAYGW